MRYAIKRWREITSQTHHQSRDTIIREETMCMYVPNHSAKLNRFIVTLLTAFYTSYYDLLFQEINKAPSVNLFRFTFKFKFLYVQLQGKKMCVLCIFLLDED